jgi:hypothetical protein
MKIESEELRLCVGLTGKFNIYWGKDLLLGHYEKFDFLENTSNIKLFMDQKGKNKYKMFKALCDRFVRDFYDIYTMENYENS